MKHMENKPNFTPRAQRAIDIAKKHARDLESESISLEHLFLGILSLKAGVVHEVLLEVGANPLSLMSAIASSLRKDSSRGAAGKSSEIKYGSRFKQVLDIAAIVSLNFGHDYIGIEHLLLAMLKYDKSPINKYFKSLNIPQDLIIDSIKNYFQMSFANIPHPDQTFFSIGPPPVEPAPQNTKMHPPKTMVEKYTINYTRLAAQDKFDRIIGKEDEILRICETLCRRTKNNPVLVGDPGVGKTASVEGLAQAIVEGSCPEHLLDKKIYCLDLAAMIAGTKYRGQFEERLKGLLDELKKDKNVVLFIDEIHTLVGAGSAEGTMDAANILKPTLARGDIKCIGATTFSEYKKTIHKDGALDRRFQPIKCSPPSPEETLEILKGIKDKYESFHYVKYEDEVLESIVSLAARYMPSKQFPDKAIDILDQTGAKIKISSFTRPVTVKKIELELENLMKEEDSLKKIGANTVDLEIKQEKLLKQYGDILTRWAAKKIKDRKVVKLSDVHKTIGQITSIPVAELSRNDAERFLNLEKKLCKKIIGQEKAVQAICQAILRSKSGLSNESKPIGSFLLLGGSGLGKTHTAKSISKVLLGDASEIIYLDMSEFSEKSAVSRLSGSSPGYVGYEEGSLLVDKICKNPYSVVLFDEIEKAHPDVIQCLLQILEEGRITDGLGRIGDFTNSIIILTGNIGSSLTHKQSSVGFGQDSSQKSNEKIIEKACEILKPEFINRLTEIVTFEPFTRGELIKIIDLEYKPLKQKAKEKGINLKIQTSCTKEIANRVEESKFGARPIARMIQKYIENPLAELIMSRAGSEEEITVSFGCSKEEINYKIKGE
jgi:ATP-dependent Clp protease ATP-binding subunit ClpC